MVDVSDKDVTARKARAERARRPCQRRLDRRLLLFFRPFLGHGTAPLQKDVVVADLAVQLAAGEAKALGGPGAVIAALAERFLDRQALRLRGDRLERDPGGH